MSIPTQKLSDLAERALQIRADIEKHQKLIKIMSESLRDIERHDMVELMNESGVEEFVYKGKKFALKLWIGGVWPKSDESAEKATKYLDSIDAAGLLKTFVSAQFGRDEHEQAQQVYDTLLRVCDPKMESKVHPMTLRAWARRRLAEGMDIDLDTLGLIAGHIVSVRSLPKRT